jgi:hypothetical protein
MRISETPACTWAEAMSGARAIRAYEIVHLDRTESGPPQDGLIDAADVEPTTRDRLLVRAWT